MRITSLLARIYGNWRARHRQGVNFWLHVVGIPACFVAAPVLLIAGQWVAAGVCFGGGYVLQFAGHFIEGNRSGEGMLFRRILGRK